MKNRLHVYTGDGKGKTTAAMGLALRSLGHGRRVLIAQFLKDGSSGELQALERLDGALVFRTQPLSGFVFRMTAAERARAAQAQTEQALRLAEEIRREKPAMAVLDELGEAVWLEMVTPEAARALIDAALECAETVVTGRDVPEWLLERADYASRISAERHPFQTEGLPAREGVEW